MTSLTKVVSTADEPSTLVDIGDVSARVVEYVPPAEQRNGASMLVFPGGGYTIHTKGELWSRWLADHGFIAFELRYNLEPRSLLQGGRAASVGPALADAKSAITLVRRRSAELGADPARLGIMGSSAGAHLAMCLCHSIPAAERPLASVLMYPPSRNPLCVCIAGTMCVSPWPCNAIMSWDGWFSKTGEHCWCNLADRDGSSQPPTFMVSSTGDMLLRPWNHADLISSSLKDAAVECEYHCGDFGDHGFGLNADWPTDKCIAWLRHKLLGPLPLNRNKDREKPSLLEDAFAPLPAHHVHSRPPIRFIGAMGLWRSCRLRGGVARSAGRRFCSLQGRRARTLRLHQEGAAA